MTADLAQHLLDLATPKGLTVTTAESCTGGMVSAAITDIAGSSAIFEYGFVTYSNGAKQQMLGVTSDSLSDFGAVSEEVAREMADGARKAAGADIAIAISGIAGPGPSEFKPEGRVCFGWSSIHGTESETIEFGAIGRPKVRQASAEHALRKLIEVTTLF